MLYGWDAGVLGGIQATPQFLDAIGNPTGAYVSTKVQEDGATTTR